MYLCIFYLDIIGYENNYTFIISSEIIQNVYICICLFSTDLNKLFHIKYVYM